MRRFFFWTITSLVLAQVNARGQTPLTSIDSRPPAAELARLWEKAKAEYQAHKTGLHRGELSELANMLKAVQEEMKLGAGVGWYLPSLRRHDWAWLAKRFDGNKDGRISRNEFPGEPAFFSRLDRDQSGEIDANDLDWSDNAHWVKQDTHALKLLRAIDRDGNGRIGEKEWLSYFQKIAGEKGFLTAKEIQTLLTADAADGAQKKQVGEKVKGKKVSKDVWLRCLFEGDLGSAFPGPNVDSVAPDFRLPTHDGERQIALSDFRGKKPVVLIFGSFT